MSLFNNKEPLIQKKWKDLDLYNKRIALNEGKKEYTLHDYAYVVNMLYSDYGNIFSEPSLYLRMAKSYLTDSDYYGNPAERAYHDAIKRIDYFS